MIRIAIFFLTFSLLRGFTGYAQCDAEVEISLSPEAPNNVYCAYDTVKLSVTTEFDAYQWYYNFSNSNVGGTPIDGATGQTLEIPIAEWGFAYFYVEVEYEDTCRTPSPPVIIDSWVFLPPAIQHDADTDLCNGDSALIQNAFGSFAAYQWYRDGSAIPGATQESYWVTAPGTYVLEVNPAVCPLITLTSGVGPTFAFSGPSTPVITESDGVLTASSGPFHQWLYEGVELPGATGPTYEPAETGFYTVTVIDASGCTAVSEPFFFETTAAGGLPSARSFRVFPNPADQWLYLENPQPETYRLEILDITGRVRFAVAGRGPATDAYNVASLHPGWYVLRLYRDKEIGQEQLLISR